MEILNTLEILESPIRKKIIRAFLKAKSTVNYKYIKELVKDDTTRADYHLSELVDHNIIERTKGRGNYMLSKTKYTLLRKLYSSEKVPVLLMGGLGQIDLYETILNSLKSISIIPSKYFLITSKDIKPEFNKEYKKYSAEIKKVKLELEVVDFQSVLRGNYPKLYEIFENKIKSEIYDYEIICELTGSTKPVSISLMMLAMRYNLQKIYYTGEKITWLEN